MIPKDKATKLVKIYCFVCEQYEKEIKHICQRFSNNNKPKFTDQEALSIYLYVMQVEEHHKVNKIHEFASEHLREWFPTLPSYVAFPMKERNTSETTRNTYLVTMRTLFKTMIEKGIVKNNVWEKIPNKDLLSHW